MDIGIQVLAIAHGSAAVKLDGTTVKAQPWFVEGALMFL